MQCAIKKTLYANKESLWGPRLKGKL